MIDTISIDRTAARLSRMSCGVRTAARLHCEAFGNQRHLYECHMHTLTYAPGDEWSPRHITGYVKKAREYYKARGYAFRFAWVAELQMNRMRNRGETAAQVLHYHVLIWLPFGVQLPKADLCGWWPHGMTRTEEVYAPIKYACKYTSKGTTEGENLPKGARVSGVGGLVQTEKCERRWWLAPRWVKEQSEISDDAMRAKGGGFVLRRVGTFLRSPWVVVAMGKHGCRIALRQDVEALGAGRESAQQ